MSKAAEYIREIANSGTRFTTKLCKVESVTGQTCNVLPIDGAPINNVRLNAVISGDSGIVITPTINSFVLVTEISENDAYVSLFSEIAKVNIKVGQSKIEINQQDIVINGGFNSGIIIRDKLDIEIKKLNLAIQTLRTATSTALDGIVPGLGATYLAATSSIQAANLMNVTNEKFKH